MNIDRWLNATRIIYRAPDDGKGSAEPAAGGGGDVAPAVESAAAPAAEAAPASSAASALASASSDTRDGAPKGDGETKPESAPSKDGAEQSSAKAGEAPPDGGTEGASDKKDVKTEPAPDASKDAKEKTGEAKPEGTDPKPDTKDAAADEQPTAPPSYDAYTLPENFKVDDGKLAEFNTLLGKAELALAADPHAAIQSLGQDLVNFYASEVQRIGQDVLKYQVDVWNRHCEQEFNQLKSDPELGGNRINTTLGNAKYVLEQFGGSKDEQDRLMASLDRSGISHNRDFVALLHRMHQRYQEPEPVQPNLPSVPARQPGQRNWYETVEGGSKA